MPMELIAWLSLAEAPSILVAGRMINRQLPLVIACYLLSSRGFTADVFTYHNDNARAGLDPTETILTPQNVNANGFGLIRNLPVDYNRVVPYKLGRNTINGEALYSYSDRQKGVVYIGGDKAYQRYKQLVKQYKIESGLQQ